MSLVMFVHFLAVLTSAGLVYSQSSDYDYIGGVALRYPDGCPTGTFAGAITYQQNCCPDGQFFPTDADYCCGNGMLDFSPCAEAFLANIYALATDCGSLVDAHVKVSISLFFGGCKIVTDNFPVRRSLMGILSQPS
jgi:hypothetical protein